MKISFHLLFLRSGAAIILLFLVCWLTDVSFLKVFLILAAILAASASTAVTPSLLSWIGVPGYVVLLWLLGLESGPAGRSNVPDAPRYSSRRILAWIGLCLAFVLFLWLGFALKIL